MPRSQKAADRPISFALHDQARNTEPIIVEMYIRPEDLSVSEPSRMTVTQTLGSAWLDDFGAGIPSVTLAGTTGWRGGAVYDGFEEFQRLHKVVFEEWHKLREEVVREGKDPDGVKLIFDDGLDDFTWCVAPQSFVLKRNRSRPLLSQYQISLLKLGDTTLEKPKKYTASEGDVAGLSSLGASIQSINEFAANIRGAIASALGPLKAGIDSLVRLTSSALQAVQSIAAAGINGLRSIAGPVLEIAQGLTKVATNVMSIVATIKSIPIEIKATFMAVKSAFQNAFCLLRNVFRASGFLPEFGGLYGASNCSSTSGGSAASPFINTNVFPGIFPATVAPVTMTAAAETAVSSLAAMDPLTPASTPVLGGALATIAAGISIGAGTIANAIADAQRVMLVVPTLTSRFGGINSLSTGS